MTRLSFLTISISLLMLSCHEKKALAPVTTFTKADSLTDTYLALRDSVLQAWNIMIDDDNQKINAMHNLNHELMVTDHADHDKLVAIERRLERLQTLRYNQQTMANAELVDEYDFATTSLISELLGIAESLEEFNYNTTLQKLVDGINLADQRVNSYRESYDYFVNRYNTFIAKNQTYLKEVDPQASFDKMPAFDVTSDE